jgi:hypothetical protein
MEGYDSIIHSPGLHFEDAGFSPLFHKRKGGLATKSITVVNL